MVFMLIISLALAVYVAARILWRPRWRWYWKLPLCVLILATACKMSLVRVFGGHYFAPDFPEWLIYLSGWLHASFIILAALLAAFHLACHLASVGCVLTRRRRLRLPPRVENRCHLGLAAVSLGLAAWGVLGVLAPPRVSEVVLECAEPPPGLEGLRIVQLSDLHVDNRVRADRVEKIVEAVNSLRPDLVVITGDLFDGEVSEHGADLEPLARLKAPLGVYGSTGNHEYYYNFDEWMSFLESLNVKMLLNSHAEPVDGLILAGIEDKRPDLKKALEGSGDGFRLILGHSPLKIIRNRDFEASGADLVLLGHTHGGAMPGLNKLVALANGGMVRGMYDFGGAKVYVSPGTGCWSGFPVRILNPAEITLFTFGRAASEVEK